MGLHPATPTSPALRESLDSGGRAITVLDGDIVVLAPNGRPRPAGQHRRRPDDAVRPVAAQHRQRPGRRGRGARASASRATAVVEGLRTFAPDDRAQPRPDEHLLAAAAERRQGSPSSSTWPTTRPASRRCSTSPADSTRPAARCTSASGSPATAPTTCLEPIGEIAGQRADRRSSPPQGALPARSRRWTTSRPTCESGWPARASPTSPRTTPSSAACRPSSRPPSTATSSR